MEQERPMKQTSYWFTHREPAYLMYLRDLAVRMDPTHPTKPAIESYIREATALQATLLEIQVGSGKEEHKQLVQALGKADGELQQQARRILATKMQVMGLQKQQEQAKLLVFSYLSTIYNQLVAQLNHLLCGQVGRTTLGRDQRLQQYREAEYDLNKFTITLYHNNPLIEKSILELKGRQKKIAMDKQIITEGLVKFFEKAGRRLFDSTSQRIESSNNIISSITKLQTEVEALDASIKQLQQIQSRKMANIGMYSAALEPRERRELGLQLPQLPQLPLLAQPAQEEGVERVGEQRENRPKIVFFHQQPNQLIWGGLLAWFTLLLLFALALL